MVLTHPPRADLTTGRSGDKEATEVKGRIFTASPPCASKILVLAASLHRAAIPVSRAIISTVTGATTMIWVGAAVISTAGHAWAIIMTVAEI